MIKNELARCCIECGCPDLEIKERPYQENGYVAISQVICCRHAVVCRKYLNEPLQALPVEQLFKGE